MTKEEYADKIANEFWDGADIFDISGLTFSNALDGTDITYITTTKKGLIAQMESLPPQEPKTLGLVFFAKNDGGYFRIDKYAVALD